MPTDGQARPSALNLSTIPAVLALSIAICGVATSHAMFYLAGLNYADYATVSDAITASVRYPMTMFFGMFVGLFLLATFWMVSRASTRRARIAWTLAMGVIVPFYLMLVWVVIIAVVSASFGNSASGSWHGYLFGHSPVVRIQIEPDALPADFPQPATIHQLAASSDYFLFSFDGKPVAIRKDLVRSILPTGQ